MKMGNDGKLSQDEIDALLDVSSTEDDDNSSSITNDFLSTMEIDTLGEIGNISFGSSATTLSTLLKEKVEITTPEVSVIAQEELKNFTFEPVSVQVNYLEGFSGKNVFVIKAEDAAIISDIMLGGDGRNPSEELNEIHLSAVQEAMNQMMGAAATSMSTVFNKRVDISPPTIHLEDPEKESEKTLGDDPFVKVTFQLKVGDLIDSTLFQLMPIHFAKELVDQLVSSEPSEEEVASTVMEEPASHKEYNDNYLEPEKNHSHAKDTKQFIGNHHPATEQSNVQQAEFSSFEPVTLNRTEQRNLDMLLDVPLKVTVELGRTKRTIKDILDLSQGSIVELDKLAGEPVDILVNEKRIATGEVVVIDENFGVRVTDILSQSDRLNKLK